VIFTITSATVVYGFLIHNTHRNIKISLMQLNIKVILILKGE